MTCSCGGEQRLDQRGLAGATGSDQDDIPDPVRAARLEILPGRSPGSALVRHTHHLQIRGNSSSRPDTRGIREVNA